MKKGIHLNHKNIAGVYLLFTTGLEEVAVEGKSVILWPIESETCIIRKTIICPTYCGMVGIQPFIPA